MSGVPHNIIPNSDGTRRRRQFSIEEKILLLQAIDSGRKKADVGKEFGITSSTLSTIVKNRAQIEESIKNADMRLQRKRMRSALYEDIDKVVYAWVLENKTRNVPVNGPSIRLKALEVANELGHETFQASAGWLNRFRERYGFALKYQIGEQPEIAPSTSVDYESGSVSNSSNFQVKAEPLDIKPEIDYSQYAGIPDHLEDPLIASVKVEPDEEDESIEESDYRITTPIVEYHEPDVGISEWSNGSEKNVSNDPPPAKRKKVTKTKEVHRQLATLQPPKEVSHVLTNDEDEYDVFGQHIASQLRLLPTEIALKAQEELRSVILKIITNYIKEKESIKELSQDEVVIKDVDEEEENINTENINVKNTEENDTDGRKKVAADGSSKEMNEPEMRRRKTAVRTLSESELRRNEELGIFGKQIAIQLRELPATIALEVQSEIISSVTKKRIEYLRTQRESSAISRCTSDENVTLLRKSPLAEKVVKNTYAY